MAIEYALSRECAVCPRPFNQAPDSAHAVRQIINPRVVLLLMGRRWVICVVCVAPIMAHSIATQHMMSLPERAATCAARAVPSACVRCAACEGGRRVVAPSDGAETWRLMCCPRVPCAACGVWDGIGMEGWLEARAAVGAATATRRPPRARARGGGSMSAAHAASQARGFDDAMRLLLLVRSTPT